VFVLGVEDSGFSLCFMIQDKVQELQLQQVYIHTNLWLSYTQHLGGYLLLHWSSYTYAGKSKFVTVLALKAYNPQLSQP
jgi:hypothetical protein